MRTLNSLENLKTDILKEDFLIEEINISNFLSNLDTVEKETTGKLGIYFFIKNNEVIYVGQTEDDLFIRLRSYKYLSNKKDRAVIEYLRKHGSQNIHLIVYTLDPNTFPISETEIYYIQTLQPTLNKQHKKIGPTGIKKPVALKPKTGLSRVKRICLIICFIFIILIFKG